MEDYIHAAKVGRHSAVELAQSYLKGYAATWWRTVRQDEGKNHGYMWVNPKPYNFRSDLVAIQLCSREL